MAVQAGVGRVVDGEIVPLGAAVIQIMRRTGQSKALATTRFMEVMEESVAGLLRDKFHPPGRTLLAAAMIK